MTWITNQHLTALNNRYLVKRDVPSYIGIELRREIVKELGFELVTRMVELGVVDYRVSLEVWSSDEHLATCVMTATFDRPYDERLDRYVDMPRIGEAQSYKQDEEKSYTDIMRADGRVLRRRLNQGKEG